MVPYQFLYINAVSRYKHLFKGYITKNDVKLYIYTINVFDVCRDMSYIQFCFLQTFIMFLSIKFVSFKICVFRMIFFSVCSNILCVLYTCIRWLLYRIKLHIYCDKLYRRLHLLNARVFAVHSFTFSSINHFPLLTSCPQSAIHFPILKTSIQAV